VKYLVRVIEFELVLLRSDSVNILFM